MLAIGVAILPSVPRLPCLCCDTGLACLVVQPMSDTLEALAERLGHRLPELTLQPLPQLLGVLDDGHRATLLVLLATAATAGFVVGRRRRPAGGRRLAFGAWRFPVFQNNGEARVANLLLRHFGHPDYHLMNHVTLRMDGATTQVDHILVSRFGVFVIETKDFSGWIFADASSTTWTQVLYRQKFKLQNPLFQNARHVRAVEGLLDFLPVDVIRSVVVFCGDAELRTEVPENVVTLEALVDYVSRHTEPVISPNRLQFCVGRLETSRLAISRQTDVEHVQNVARWRRG